MSSLNTNNSYKNFKIVSQIISSNNYRGHWCKKTISIRYGSKSKSSKQKTLFNTTTQTKT